jgi:hypothetical protein
MKIKIYSLSILLFILCFTSILSQPIDKEYNKHIEKFFSLVNVDKYDEAIDYIYSNNPWMKLKQMI